MEKKGYSDWLFGRYLLKILDVRNFGTIGSDDETDRYYSEIIQSPKDSFVKPGDIVSVKLSNNGKRPDEKPKHRFFGEIGIFDGRDNDIQNFPNKKNIKTNRTGSTYKNPFEKNTKQLIVKEIW